MPDRVGFSVYLSTFEDQRAALARRPGAAAFLSLHMEEEFSPDYRRRAEDVCRGLNEFGLRVIADISPSTSIQLGEPDLVRLARHLGLWGLRVDYGLDENAVLALAGELPVAVNASTLSPDSAERIARAGRRVIAMHNFYPRPETGLDGDVFRTRTRLLQEAGCKVYAFLPGDGPLRGPVHAGLPTLEAHRGLPPSVCLADLTVNYGVDGAFVGDPGVSERELARMDRFQAEGVLELPARLSEGCRDLCGKVFTCRTDSPRRLIRVRESREYSRSGRHVEPLPPAPRPRGSVTVDNALYGRYSGEIQIVREDLPADPRVNVVGRVAERYLPALEAIPGGGRFALTAE